MQVFIGAKLPQPGRFPLSERDPANLTKYPEFDRFWANANRLGDNMAAGTFTLYNGVSEYIGDGTLDMDNDTFNISLHTSAYTPSATHDAYADLTNELATANGYTNGGAALASVTWTRSGAVAKFDSADQVWTASGGSIAARYAVVRSTTADKLLGYMLLDSTPADITATDGNTMTVGPSASNGWFQVTANG